MSDHDSSDSEPCLDAESASDIDDISDKLPDTTVNNPSTRRNDDMQCVLAILQKSFKEEKIHTEKQLEIINKTVMENKVEFSEEIEKLHVRADTGIQERTQNMRDITQLNNNFDDYACIRYEYNKQAKRLKCLLYASASVCTIHAIVCLFTIGKKLIKK